MSEQLPSNEDLRHKLIEPNRQLIPEGVSFQLGVSEYYDNYIGLRLIEMGATGVQAARHIQLLEKRLPVFSSLYNENERLQLIVPEGTRTVHQALKFIARDVTTYMEIFTQFGELIQELERSELGLPSVTADRSLLSGIAFAPDDRVAYGTRLYLTPPYALDNTKNANEILSELDAELSTTHYFDFTVHRQLIESFLIGYKDA